MNKPMELLSPAGDEAALQAAVRAGADAVYLGYATFGARASATNFDAEQLERAVAYAHLYHVRVHVTVNTLVKQCELEDVYQALAVIAHCGADAIIVQDLGVARLARECFPSLALHASTQMALHNAAGARFAMQQGFRRVVLARECTLDAIREVAATGIDTEVFVHGALCAGVSGQCLLSSMAGGRSGNRGRCAQPCRQQIRLGDQTAALLSTRDLCLRNHLPELQAAGVRSLKIEGRLKRAEYVAVVTERYRKALDALARGDFQPADEAETQALRQIFNRGGFTVGHAMSAQDADLCSIERANHEGVPMGAVTAVRGNLATVRLTKRLNDGDGLQLRGRGDVELRYSGNAEETSATLRIRPDEDVRVGDAVARLTDASQIACAQALTDPKIPVTMHMVAIPGEALRLTATDGEASVTVEGETTQAARSRATTAEEIAKQLAKLGDTPFTLETSPHIESADAFVPVSSLNALRREAIAQLQAERIRLFGGDAPQAKPMPADVPMRAAATLVNELAVQFSDADAARALRDAGATLLLFEPTDWREEALRDSLAKLPDGAWLALAPQMTQGDCERVSALLGEYPLAGVVVGSVGQLGMRWKLPVVLGGGVPVCNSFAAQALLGGARFMVLWSELTLEEQAAIGLQAFPCLLPCYGRERVMLLNHCPERVLRGLRAHRADCALCKAGDRACARADAALIDRKGYRFPLVRSRFDNGCVLNLYNALPTELSARDQLRRELNAGMLLRFTTETRDECVAITKDYAEALHSGTPPREHGASTSGHMTRGVW